MLGVCLQQVLRNERLAHALAYKVRDYYYTERLYLLQSVKVIVNSWQNNLHPFQVLVNCRELSLSHKHTNTHKHITNQILCANGNHSHCIVTLFDFSERVWDFYEEYRGSQWEFDENGKHIVKLTI